jgi:hypothetical protein
MLYYGHGFTWTELYNMPIWLRKFYYKKIEEALDRHKKATTPQPLKNKKQLSRPGIAP